MVDALVGLYERIGANVERMRLQCTGEDLDGLLTLADIADYAEETSDRYARGQRLWRRDAPLLT